MVQASAVETLRKPLVTHSGGPISDALRASIVKLGRENFKIYKSGVCLKLMASSTFQVHSLMDYLTSINT